MDKLLTLLVGMISAGQKDKRSLIERSVSFLLLGLICIFALNSIGNVQKYVHQYHHHWTGDALGIAFGTVVFVCAYIAATTSGQTRWVSIAIGSVFGIASAYFQTELYMSEGMKSGTAHSLSYIPILAGEVGLALLESLYSKRHKHEETADEVTDSLAQLRAKDEVLATLQQELKQQCQFIEQLKTAQPLRKSADDLSSLSALNGQQSAAQVRIPAASELLQSRSTKEITEQVDAEAHVRAALKEQRKAAIPHILAATQRPLSTSELADAMQVSYGWEVSTDSIRRYCQELFDEQVVETRKRKWHLRTTDAQHMDGHNGYH